LSEWPRRSPATLPFSPRRSPWASCATRSFELSGAAMPSHEGVRPIPARRPCHSSQSARRNAHGHFLAHASRSGWPWQGDGGRQHHIDTDDGPHHEMGSHLIAIPPYVHPPQVLSTTSVCKFFRGHSVGGCPRSCRTFCTGSASCDRTAGTPRQRPPSSNLHVELTLAWAPFWGVPLACLDPARRAWSSTFLPAPVRRKQAQHTPSPPRTQIIMDPGLRCALPPDSSHWALPLLTVPQCACARQDRARHPQRPVTSPGSSRTFSFRRCCPYPPFLLIFSTVVSSSPVLFSVLVVSYWCVGAGRMSRISSGSFSRCSYRVICTKMDPQNTLPTLYSCLSPVESLPALHTIGVGVHLLQRREEPWRCTGSHLRLAPALLMRQES